MLVVFETVYRCKDTGQHLSRVFVSYPDVKCKCKAAAVSGYFPAVLKMFTCDWMCVYLNVVVCPMPELYLKGMDVCITRYVQRMLKQTQPLVTGENCK